MSQHYSNPARESEETALPDVEVWHSLYRTCPECKTLVLSNGDTRTACPNCGRMISGYDDKGWFWWACFPGCLPDSDPFGPFPTKAQALADAQDCNDCP